MGKRTLNFAVGSYVNWHEDYADGISGKDWGDGIIIEKTTHDAFGNCEYFMFKVYRTKHKDFYWFEKRQLRLKEIK